MRYDKIYITFIFLLAVTSCKKSFLDVPLEESVARQDYVKDLGTTAAYLYGLYPILSQGVIGNYNMVYPELIADNIKPRRTILVAQYNWAQVADNNAASMNSLWLKGYLVIRSASFAIKMAEQFKNEDPAKAADIKAQALAIRAYTNFVLVNIFAQPYSYSANGAHAGIPYITTDDWTQPVTERQTVAEVYNGMITDLTEAIPLFSQNSPGTIYFNRQAAKALLARIYLFKGDNEQAKNQARDVAAAVPLMTGPAYPSKLFTPQETEALFQVPPASTVAGDSYNINLQGRFFVGSSGAVLFIATDEMAGLLTADPSDLRKAWITTSSLGKTITKYPVNVIPGYNPTSNSYYQTILRSSEMYLTAAEAYANLNREDSAIYYLDAIRLRANPSAAPTTATGPALRSAINTERRKELAFEGLRMFDLLRRKEPVNRTDAPNPAVQTLPYPSDKAIAPIPQSDVELIGLLQNPGYN